MSFAARRGWTLLRTSKNWPCRFESTTKAVADVRHYLADDGYVPPTSASLKPERDVRSPKASKSQEAPVPVRETAPAKPAPKEASLRNERASITAALKKHDFTSALKCWERCQEYKLSTTDYTEFLKICVMHMSGPKENRTGPLLAIRVFDKLLDSEQVIDANACDLVAKACGMLGDAVYLKKVEAVMSEKGISQSDSWRSDRVKACARSFKYIKEADREYAKMKEEGILGAPSMYKALVSAHTTRNRTSQATRVLRDMETAGYHLTPALCRWVLTTAIDQMDSRSLRQLADWELKASGHMDRGTCQAILNVAARKGEADLALSMWAVMEDSGYEPTAEAYEAMIFTLACVRDDASLAGALVEMEVKRGLVPSPGLVKVVAEKLATSVKRIDEVYFLLKQMKQEEEENDGDTPAAVTLSALNVVIGACAEIQDLNRAFSTFEDVSNFFHLTPDTTSFKFLLKACSQFRNGAQPEAAVLVLEDMERAGFEADSEAYRYLLLSLARGRQYAKMDDVIERLEYDNKTELLSADTLACLAHHFAFEGDLTRAHTFHTQIAMLGLHAPSYLTQRLSQSDDDLLTSK